MEETNFIKCEPGWLIPLEADREGYSKLPSGQSLMDKLVKIKTEPELTSPSHGIKEEIVVPIKEEYEVQGIKEETFDEEFNSTTATLNGDTEDEVVKNGENWRDTTSSDKDEQEEASIYDSTLKEISRDVQSWTCEYCGESFKNKPCLNEHMEVHIKENKVLTDVAKTKKRAHSCNVCYKTFSERRNLVVHMRRHTGERPFACTLCNKTCSDKSSLIKHGQVHTMEKPHSCSLCDKTYKDRGGLRRHSLIHSGERPYCCKVCKKGFRRRSGLVDHLKTHSGDRPFPCSVCSKTFRSRNNLKSHVLTHAIEKPHSCPTCGTCFVSRRYLTKHAVRHVTTKNTTL